MRKALYGLLCLGVIVGVASWMLEGTLQEGMRRLDMQQGRTVSFPQAITPAQAATGELGEEILTELYTAQQEALIFAHEELQVWHDQHMKFANNDFIPWLLGYGTKWGFLGATLKNWVTGGDSEKEINDETLRQFRRLVVNQANSQAELEKISISTVEKFVSLTQEKFENLRGEYNIPQANWNAYFDDMYITLSDENNNEFPITVGSMVAGSGFVTVKGLIIPVSKVAVSSTKGLFAGLAKSFAGKASASSLGAAIAKYGTGIGLKGTAIAKTATAAAGNTAGSQTAAASKTATLKATASAKAAAATKAAATAAAAKGASSAGGAVLAKGAAVALGGKAAAAAGAATFPVLGWAVAGGILAWEIWSHSSTVEENTPILRKSISESLGAFAAEQLTAEGTVAGPLFEVTELVTHVVAERVAEDNKSNL